MLANAHQVRAGLLDTKRGNWWRQAERGRSATWEYSATLSLSRSTYLFPAICFSLLPT